MKNRRGHGLLVNIFRGVLAIILVVGVMCIAAPDEKYVHAEDNQGEVVKITDTEIDYKVKKYSDISVYRTKDADGDFTAPTLTTAELVAAEDTTPGEWLFAGWFTDQACTSALASSIIATEDTSVPTGTYYAKFVSTDVLSVKCQITAGTVSGDSETVLRCISTVDSLKYQSVGLHLVRPDKTVGTMEKSKVSKRIYAREDVDVEAYSYSPKVVDTESEYFFSATEVVNKDNFGEQYIVKPYWITKDGTTVWGVSRCVTVNEAINKDVMYIPVKMDDAPANGVTFTATNGTKEYSLTYCDKYDADTGYAHFALTTDNEGASIKTDALKSVTTYTITGSDETTASYVYRNLHTTVGASDNRDTSWYTEAIAINPNENEFVIATSADLYGFANVVNGTDITADVFTGKTVYMVADIAADETESTINWPGIGILKANQGFAGTFDGQMHTISGIEQTRTANGAGLFTDIQANAVIKNFELINSSFDGGNKQYIGSIVGNARGGVVENVFSNATITNGNKFTGGLVGAVNITAGDFHMKGCWFAGSVANNANFLGGLIGTIGTGPSSTNTNTHKITDCLNTGDINVGSASKYVGGLFGFNYSNEMTSTRCVSTGEIKGVTTEHTNFGTIGLVGGFNPTCCPTYISTYATEQDVVTKDTYANEVDLVALNYCNVDPTAIAGTSVLTVALNKENSQNNEEPKTLFTNVTNEKTYENESYWAITQGAPVLSAFADVAGVQYQAVDTSWFRTDKTSFTLKDAADLYGLALLSRDSIAECFENETIYLGADIVMNEGITYDSNGPTGGATPIEWLPIGSSSSPFEGEFDGNNKNISGAYLSATSACNGLFGYTGFGPTIKKFSLTNSYFISTGTDTGSIVGLAKGGIFDSIYSASIVSSNNVHTGGFIGKMDCGADKTSTFTMNNCWFAGTVTNTGGTNIIGGLVGRLTNRTQTRTIKNCLNTGHVVATEAGTRYMGGLVGYNETGSGLSIVNCLNARTIEYNPLVSDTDIKTYGLIGGQLQNKTKITNVYTISQENISYSGNLASPDESYIVSATEIIGIDVAEKLPGLFDSNKTESGEDYWVTTTTTPVLNTFKKFAVGGADE